MVVGNCMLFSCTHKLSTELKESSGLWVTSLVVCFVFLSIWKIHGHKLQLSNWWLKRLHHYFHTVRSPQNDTYFVKCTNPPCIKTTPQHDAVTLKLGWCSLFHPNAALVTMTKKFHQTTEYVSKSYFIYPSIYLLLIIVILFVFWHNSISACVTINWITILTSFNLEVIFLDVSTWI